MMHQEEENGTDDDVESIEFELDVDKVLEDLYSDDYEEEEEDEKEDGKGEKDVKVGKDDGNSAGDSEIEDVNEESSHQTEEDDGEGDVGDTSKGTNQAGSENEEEEEIEFVDSTSSTIKDDEEGEEKVGQKEEEYEEEGEEDEVEREVVEEEEADVVQEYEFIENMIVSDHSLSTLDVSHQDEGNDGPLNTTPVTSNNRKVEERNKEWIRILGSTTIPKPYIYHINLGSNEGGEGGGGSDEIPNILPRDDRNDEKEDRADDRGEEKKSELKNNLTTRFKLLPEKSQPQEELPSIKLMSFGSSLGGKSNDPFSTVSTQEEENKEQEDENQHILSRLTRKEGASEEDVGRERGKMSKKMISETEDDVEDEMMKRRKDENENEKRRRKEEEEEDQMWMRDDDADDSHGYSGRERTKNGKEGRKIKTGESDRFSPEKREKEEKSTIGIHDENRRREKEESGIKENEVIHERVAKRGNEVGRKKHELGEEMMSEDSEETKVTKRGTEGSEERGKVKEGKEGRKKEDESELRGISNERKKAPSLSSLSFRDVNFDLDLFLEPSTEEKKKEKMLFAEFADKNDSFPNDKDSNTSRNFKQKRELVAQYQKATTKNEDQRSSESTIAGKDENSSPSSTSPLILDPFHGLSQSKVTLELRREGKEETSSYQGRNGRQEIQEYFRNCPNQVDQKEEEENHVMYQSSKKSEVKERKEKLDEPILPTMIAVVKGMGTGSTSSLQLISAQREGEEKGHESNGDRDWDREDERGRKGERERRHENEQSYDGRKVRGAREEKEEMNSERKYYQSAGGEKVTRKSSSLLLLPPHSQRGIFHFKMEISGLKVSKEEEPSSLPGMNEQGHHKNGMGDLNDGRKAMPCTLSQSKQTSSDEDDGNGKEVSLYLREDEKEEERMKGKRRREESSKSVRWEGRGVVKESIYDNEDDQVLMESEGCISATFTVHSGESCCCLASPCCCASKGGNKLQSILEQGEEREKKNESGKNFLFSSSSKERSSNSNNKLATSSSSKFLHSSETIPNETCINKQPLSPFTSHHTSTVDAGDPSRRKGRTVHRSESGSRNETSSVPFSKINTEESKFQLISTLQVNDQIGRPREGANEIRERERNEKGPEVEMRSKASRSNIETAFRGSGKDGRWSESRFEESEGGEQNLTVIQERLKWLQSKLEQLDQRTIQLAFRNKEERPRESMILSQNNSRRMVRKTTKIAQNDEYDVQNENVVQRTHRFLVGRKFRSESSSSSTSSSSLSDFYCSRHRYRNHEYQSTPDIRTSSTSLLILIKRTTSMLRNEVRELELLGKY